MVKIQKLLPKQMVELLENFLEISDIKEKFEFLLELSEELPPFPTSKKINENKVNGCASNAWITVSKIPEKNVIKILGIGDALISKGIISFFIKCFDGLSAKEILEIKYVFPNIFFEYGIFSSLSPSRSNGAKAMLEKIYNECEKIKEKL